MIKRFKNTWMIGVVTMALMMTGCGESKYVNAEKFQHIEAKNTGIQASTAMQDLKRSLDNGNIRNAKLIKLYANQIKSQKPDLSLIVEELSKESGTNGMLFSGLKSRIESNKEALLKTKSLLDSSPKDDAAYLRALNKYNNTIIPENQALLGAMQPEVYNDALSDIVNTLADLSGGTLARVDGKKSSDFYKESGAENKGAGSLLVGNPNYGEWKKDSNGNSFWTFFGQMMMLNAIMDLGSRPYYYNSWYNQRPYSSYHDHYGSRYGSHKYRTNTAKLNSKYKINPKTNGSLAAKNYTRNNPSVTKKFNKFDNQFARKSPNSKVLSRTSVKPKNRTGSVSKINGNGSKWGNQYSGKSTKGSGGTRSSRSGK
jgi:hypothetical protein